MKHHFLPIAIATGALFLLGATSAFAEINPFTGQPLEGSVASTTTPPVEASAQAATPQAASQDKPAQSNVASGHPPAPSKVSTGASAHVEKTGDSCAVCANASKPSKAPQAHALNRANHRPTARSSGTRSAVAQHKPSNGQVGTLLAVMNVEGNRSALMEVRNKRFHLAEGQATSEGQVYIQDSRTSVIGNQVYQVGAVEVSRVISPDPVRASSRSKP